MKHSELFKYDVRVRERMLTKGLLADKDLARHLEALPDREPSSERVSLEQPAIGRHEPGGMRRAESNGADTSDDEDEA
jgi:hypothetical protein